jgi:hypothetical protein
MQDIPRAFVAAATLLKAHFVEYELSPAFIDRTGLRNVGRGTALEVVHA